ncbi:MAG: S8 family serine peptidase, partial [Planctomycetes bacterium]|nr:S8 family serine peptidase [Planctomycetota bacterium]
MLEAWANCCLAQPGYIYRALVTFVGVTAFIAAPAAGGAVRWRSVESKPVPVMSSAQAGQVLRGLVADRGLRHVVVHFSEPAGPRIHRRLEHAGVKLLAYLGDNAFFAAVSESRLHLGRLARVESLVSAQAIERNFKLHPFFVADTIPDYALVGETPNPVTGVREDVVAAYILFHRDVLLNNGIGVVQQLGAVVRNRLETVNGLVIELPRSALGPLADRDEVQWIEPPLPKWSEVNDSNRSRTGADVVQEAPYNLDGSGVTVLVYDGGTGRASHQDFGGRLTVRDNSGQSGHATHVAGTIGGSGAASGGLFKGMAPGVTLESYGFERAGGGIFLYQDPGDMEDDYGEAINDFGADVSNNSIGTNTESNGFPCEIQGDYGVTASVIDGIVIGSLGKPFRIVWANGNERQGSRCDVEGFGDYYSTAPPACAKNHITVGALNSNNDGMTGFSSWGPCDDGRIKPDISAPGCQSSGDGGVTSCSGSSDTGYSVACGTSMASPTVCGLAALLIEDYRDQFGGGLDGDEPVDPRNSTLKALLAHTATDRGNVGPDYQFGYGSVRIQPAVDALRARRSLEREVNHGQSFSATVVVGDGTPELKVTLAWDDVPGTPNVIPSLVHDLDLQVFSPSQVRAFPWTLDPLDPGAPAVRNRDDHINNIEQVLVNNPEPGNWTVEVHGLFIPESPQGF